MSEKNRSDHTPYEPTPSAKAVFGSPEDCCKYVNKYGTYNIQPTADSDYDYPAIAHGLPKKKEEE